MPTLAAKIDLNLSKLVQNTFTMQAWSIGLIDNNFLFFVQLKMNKYLDKGQYLKDAAAFAHEVADDLSEPEAEKLFCPAFKLKSCGCIQRFITGGDGESVLRNSYQYLKLSPF